MIFHNSNRNRSQSRVHSLMKIHNLICLLLFCGHPMLRAEPVKASDERFKLEYVVPKVPLTLEALPSYVPGREEAIQKEAELTSSGMNAEQIAEFRKTHLEGSVYPIRITDKETGIIYEVQGDRRTVVAKKPNGDLVWKINPFVDSKMRPYRVDYPYIDYFVVWKYSTRPESPVLRICFNSSQFGDIELESGKFRYHGQD